MVGRVKIELHNYNILQRNNSRVSIITVLVITHLYGVYKCNSLASPKRDDVEVAHLSFSVDEVACLCPGDGSYISAFLSFSSLLILERNKLE